MRQRSDASICIVFALWHRYAVPMLAASAPSGQNHSLLNIQPWFGGSLSTTTKCLRNDSLSLENISTRMSMASIPHIASISEATTLDYLCPPHFTSFRHRSFSQL
ncbi:hypothetical protein DL93DRAFT_2087429 [Clavulina sp. PMI_390]|nr:hypothetical protein DL93DRAFT_2087429 [Clavulina sp. PMI_390]